MTGFAHEPPAGGSPEWYTPPEIFAALGVEFDLDPCAPKWPKAHWIPAERRITLPDDGMQHPWEGRVWLNPPYARETARWVARLAEHGDGIALVFARTDTIWWQSAIATADAICFIAGRVNFRSSDPSFRGSNGTLSNAGAPSCLLAFGDHNAGALIRSGLGACLVANNAAVSAQLKMWSTAA